MRRSPRSLPPLATVVVAALLAGTPSASWGQIAAGSVKDSITSAPLSGAIVSIARAGDEGTALRQARVGGDGAFELLAPGPGSFVVTARAVGYAMWRRALSLAGGETVRLEIALGRNEVRLSEVRVAERNACVPPDDAPADAGALRALWSDTWVALTSSRLTAGRTVGAAGIMRYERDLDARTHLIRREVRHVERGRAVEPFVAAPAGELAREGFIREASDGSMEIFAPDAATITSQDFIRRHCFAVAPPQRGTGASRVGLRFWPRDDFASRGIDGTFWLDATTRQLQEIAFSYPRLAAVGSAADSLGGRVRFSRTADGAWYVSEWRIRFPALHRERRPLTWKGEHVVNEGRDSVVAIDERGGIVLRGEQRRDVAPEGDPQLGGIHGTLRASDGLPVAATVELLGTGIATKSDSAGAFAFTQLVPGRYALRAIATGSDVPGAFLVQRAVDVREGTETTLPDSAAPAIVDAARASCNAGRRRDDSTMALVAVVRTKDGQPAALTRIDARWLRFGIDRGQEAVSMRSVLAELTTDSTGVLRLCAAPPRAALAFRTAGGGGNGEKEWSWPVEVGETWSVLEVWLDATGTVAEVRGAAPSRSIQLALSPDSPPTPRLAPVVVEAPASVDVRDVHGFESRRAAGFGIFMTAKELGEERGNASLESAIRSRVNGFEFVPLYRGGMRSGFALAARRFRTMNGGRIGPCLSQVFVDGVRINGMRGDAVDLDQLPLADVAAIELYRGASETPTEFSGPSAACGTLVIWTKRR